jgi:hypothetical protein
MKNQANVFGCHHPSLWVGSNVVVSWGKKKKKSPKKKFLIS